MKSRALPLASRDLGSLLGLLLLLCKKLTGSSPFTSVCSSVRPGAWLCGFKALQLGDGLTPLGA